MRENRHQDPARAARRAAEERRVRPNDRIGLSSSSSSSSFSSKHKRPAAASRTRTATAQNATVDDNDGASAHCGDCVPWLCFFGVVAVAVLCWMIYRFTKSCDVWGEFLGLCGLLWLVFPLAAGLGMLICVCCVQQCCKPQVSPESIMVQV